MATQKTGKLASYVHPLASLACFMAIASLSQTTAALEYSLDNHRFEFATRARVVHVDTQNSARSASLLLRLRATSEWSTQLATLLELDYVALGWEDEFSNGVHFNGNPVIPDVAGSDLNQALVRYSPTNTLQLTLGREAINLGNQRFVGTNGFWQNEQTFDTAGFKYEFGMASHLLYRYVDNANRIHGDDAGKYLSPSDANFAANNGLRPASFLGDHHHHTHLIFAQFKEWDYSQIQAYYFDMEIKDAAVLSNQTLGLRYEYKGRWGKLRTLAHGELALQERNDIDDGTTLQFYDIGAGIGYRSSEVSINYQGLGENNGISFITPLASLHDHNGWTDTFLVTPNSGLRDYSLQYIWRQNPVRIDARFHIFHTDVYNSEVGKEFDIDMVVKLSRGDSILLRYADFFSSDNAFADERRVFLMYTHNL
jgi:hypothetical protein